MKRRVVLLLLMLCGFLHPAAAAAERHQSPGAPSALDGEANPAVSDAQTPPRPAPQTDPALLPCEPAARFDQYATYVNTGYLLSLVLATLAILAHSIRRVRLIPFSWPDGHLLPFAAGLYLAAELPLRILQFGETDGLLGLYCANTEAAEQGKHILTFLLTYCALYVGGALVAAWLSRRKFRPTRRVRNGVQG